MFEFEKLNTFFSFDLFGLQNYLMPFDYPSDSQRINLIQLLLDEMNCPERVMISSDIHTKHALVIYIFTIVDLITLATSDHVVGKVWRTRLQEIGKVCSQSHEK